MPKASNNYQWFARLMSSGQSDSMPVCTNFTLASLSYMTSNKRNQLAYYWKNVRSCSAFCKMA